MLESLHDALAEVYSATLSENVRRGMSENALKGLWNGGSVPLGYRVNSDRKLEIDPESALVVKEIYKLYSDGNTIMDIFLVSILSVIILIHMKEELMKKGSDTH